MITDPRIQEARRADAGMIRLHVPLSPIPRPGRTRDRARARGERFDSTKRRGTVHRYPRVPKRGA